MTGTQAGRFPGWYHFITDGILLVDGDLRVVDANQRFRELFSPGSTGSWVGAELASILDRGQFGDFFEAILASQRTGTRSDALGKWHLGRLLDVEINPISGDASGGSCVIVRDITEKYRSEETIHKSAIIVQLLQSVAIAANEATNWKSVLQSTLRNICGASGWQCGLVFVPAKANPGEMKASGIFYSRPELATRPDLEHELIRLALGIDISARMAGSPQAFWISDLEDDPVFKGSRVENGIGVKSVFAFPVRLKGKGVAALVFFSTSRLEPDHLLIEVSDNLGDQIARVVERESSSRIISEQQMQLAAASKLSALGEMAGGIAHEINNPLAAIHALAGQLRELAEENEASAPIVAGIAEKIERTSMRIAKIVKGLRVLARDGQNDPLEVIAVQGIVDDTLVFCAERLRVSGVEVSFDDTCPNARIRCRGIQVAQVLLNLINNSFDAIQAREKRWIRIKAEEVGAFVEISVIDSGKGIPFDVQERMFLPFFTTKEVGKGTGLGLSLSKAIMEGQGGGLVFDPTHEHTRFVIRVPRA
ncbi:MAG: ATP-binding protein [Oligoflexia bacterium]|nr:ATP-binding protein [Oligoflexia bacterium]